MKRAIPFVVVFITSMEIMLVELVASRIVSKYFGSSLYTWTGVIGIVLGGGACIFPLFLDRHYPGSGSNMKVRVPNPMRPVV